MRAWERRQALVLNLPARAQPGTSVMTASLWSVADKEKWWQYRIGSEVTLEFGSGGTECPGPESLRQPWSKIYGDGYTPIGLTTKTKSFSCFLFIGISFIFQQLQLP